MPEKDRRIHIRISEAEKKKWKEYFKKDGLSVSAGIRARINKLIREEILQEKFTFQESSNISERVDQLSEKLNFIEKSLKKQTIETESPDPIIIDDFNDLKNKIKEKIKFYGPLSTLSLSDLLEIPGPSMLSIMKKIIKEPDQNFFMNDNFEWCIKDQNRK